MLFRTSLISMTFGLLLVAIRFPAPEYVSATPGANVTDDQPTLNFPDNLTFHATFESSMPITSVILEYGTDQLTCASVTAKAFPKIIPGTTVKADWTWEMRQSGSLPPGATLWWRWRYTDDHGNESVSEKKTLTWLDHVYNWQTASSGVINIHWYSGDKAFANELLNAATRGLKRLQNEAGLQPDQPIQIYIYANTNDMKNAILYEPSWTGGMAYSDHNIVIIGISQQDLAWGRTTIAHELTHVLVGHLTFSCLGNVPTWLNEGLAVYSEGELDPASQSQLNAAVRNDQLLTVRSLSGSFSEVPSRANLSYSQSYSIVKYLIDSYGQDRMNALLIALRDGSTIDEALIRVYGFGIDNLENSWRKAIGATPRAASAQPTAQPTPTFVPTYVPFSGGQDHIIPTPGIIPTSSGLQPTPQPGGPPVELTLMLVVVCCVLGLLFGVLGLGAYLASQKRNGDHDEPGR